jgi:hypothetical protein
MNNTTATEATYAISKQLKLYMEEDVQSAKTASDLLGTPVTSMSDTQLRALVGLILHATDDPEELLASAAITDAVKAIFTNDDGSFRISIGAARFLTVMQTIVTTATKKAAKKAVKKMTEKLVDSVTTPLVVAMSNLEHAVNIRMDRVDDALDMDEFDDIDDFDDCYVFGIDIEDAADFIRLLTPEDLKSGADVITMKCQTYFADDIEDDDVDEDDIADFVNFITTLSPDDLHGSKRDLMSILIKNVPPVEFPDISQFVPAAGTGGGVGGPLADFVSFIKGMPTDILQTAKEAQIVNMYLTALESKAKKK